MTAPTRDELLARPDSDLAFVETDRLIDEMVRRFHAGLLIAERQEKADHTQRMIRSWGNSTWGRGAAGILGDFAEQVANEAWYPDGVDRAMAGDDDDSDS